VSLPIPPPHEPIADKDGRMNDVWYRFLEGNIRALNTAEGMVPSTLPVPVAEGGTGQITAAEALGEMTQALSINSTSATTARYVATYNSSTDTADRFLLSDTMIVNGGVTALTSNVVPITGIPAGVRRLTVTYAGVNVNTTARILVQLGTTSGAVATGYTGGLGVVTSAGLVAARLSTAGFALAYGTSADPVDGTLTINRLTSHTWVATSITANSSAGDVYYSAGALPAGAEVDRVVFTSAPTTLAFSAGSAALFWEF
jgi:hypothetical protein